PTKSLLHKAPADFSTAAGENLRAAGANSRQNQGVSAVPSGAPWASQRSCLPHMPGSAVPCHERLHSLGSPCASRVKRQVSSPLRFPVLTHGVNQRPGLVDPVRTRKERLI